MVEEGDGERIPEQALRPRGIGGGVQPRQLGEGRQVAESRIARRAEHRRREVPLPAVHPREERRELELPDRDVEAHGSEPGLNHLLERRLAAPDGEQLERDAPAAEQPPRGVGLRGDRTHRHIAGNRRWHGAVRDRAEAVQVPVDDLAAIERERDGEPHAGVAERRDAGVEHDPVRIEQWVVDNRERRVLADERGVRWLDAGEVDLARGERGELGRRLVHDHHDKPLERRRSPQGSREVRVGGEHPAAARLVRHEAERPVADGVLVPGGAPQLRAGNRVEQAGGEDGEVGEHVRHDGLRMIEPHHHRRIVRIVHERHVGEVVHARVPRRRVAGGGERPGDVARGRRNAVVPTHAGPQPERDHPLIGRPRPGARQIGLGRERRIVAHQGREQHVALHLLGERVHGEQRVHALKVRPRSVDHGATPVRGSRAARRHRDPPGDQPQRSSPHARILAGLRGSREIRRMLTHLGTRTLAGAVVVAGVVTLTFLLVRLVPGDPVERLLAPTATSAQLAAQRRALGLDRPLATQYAIWVGRFARGAWGRSIATGLAVRARRDARRHEPAVRENGGGQGIDGVPGYTTPRCTKCVDPGDYTDGPVVAGAVLWCGAGGGRVRMARRRPAPGRGGPGPRLPGGRGSDRGVGRVGRRSEPAHRLGHRVDRPAHTAREKDDVRRLWRDHRAAFGAAVLAIVTGVAVAAPLAALGSPTAPHDVVATRFLRPLATDHAGTFHPLGTDRFGRDVWTRLVYGARVSLTVGALAVLLSVVIGVVVGGAAGYWSGPVRTPLLALTDFVLALPRVVLLLLLAAMTRPSAALVIVVLGLTGWMSVARLVQGEVRSLAARPFIEGAVALGLSRGRVLVRHILPNALTPVIVSAALGLGNAITLEASLSFLGLGVQPPTPSWGNMIASGRDTLVNATWVATATGLELVLVVVA